VNSGRFLTLLGLLQTSAWAYKTGGMDVAGMEYRVRDELIAIKLLFETMDWLILGLSALV
jgi:hypothetical protein